MSTSDYQENKTNDHTLGVAQDVYSAGGRYLALYTADPTDANITANEVDTTVDDTAYARQAISFAASSGGVSASSNTQTFPAVVYGTGAAPYNATHYAIMDAITAGNMLYHAALGSPITRIAAATMVVNTGDITVTQN